MAGRSLVLIAVLIGPLAAHASVQEQRQGDVVHGQPARPKVGLALSGGGVKGFAHVGALRIIESMGIPVDVVAGTSMGSFVGGLYAMGYTVDQLDSLLRAEDWRVLFEEESPRRQQPLEYRLAEEGLLLSLPVRGGQVELPRGLVAGHRISQMLARLFFPASRTRDFRQLPISFGAVAADLADGEAVLLTSGSLAAAVRASISLPSVFDPVVIDGRTLIDGGVTRNLPAQDALALGADAVICVDVGEPVLPVDSLRSLVSIMVQAVGFRMLESNRAQQRLCDVLIAPDVKGVGAFQFERTAEIIARGEEAATHVRSHLAALRDSLFKPPNDAITRIPSRIRDLDSVLVGDMRVRGVSSPNEAVIRRSMRLTLPDYLSQSELQEAVDRAYRSQRFARVTYRFDASGRDTVESAPATLVVSAVERSGDRVSLGLRYDSDYRASILMRVTLSNVLGYNTRLVGSIRLGEILRAEAALATPMGLGVPGRLFANMDASRTPIDLFTDGRRTSNLVAHTLETSIRVGGFIRRHVALAVGIRGEVYDIDPRIAQSPGISFDFLNERSGLVFGEALIHLDTFDRVSFPTKGLKVSARSSATVAPLSSDEFGQHMVDAEARAPLGRRVSLSGRIALGRTVGGPTPLHYRFYAGGTFPFEALAGRHFPLFGRDLQEVSGPNMRAVWGGVQVEVRRDLVIGALWNAASATDRWVGDVDPDDFQTGIGISAGIRSTVGPIQAIVTAGDLDGPYQLHVSVGHAF